MSSMDINTLLTGAYGAVEGIMDAIDAGKLDVELEAAGSDATVTATEASRALSAIDALGQMFGLELAS